MVLMSWGKLGVDDTESQNLGIPVVDFLRMLIKQYFNNIKFERERKEEGS